jgi:glycosyltransferase involved in cell wall biosynthesis
VFALTANPEIEWNFGGRKLNTTFLDRGPLREHRSLTLPLMPAAWRMASREQYDVVITSSVGCVKGFYPGRSALHLSYVYAPLRYIWDPDIDRRTRLRIPKSVLGAFRTWDCNASEYVDQFAAVSNEISERIMRAYGRESRVINPPVNTEFYRPATTASPSRGYLLAASRMVPYKRLDIAIETAAMLDRELVVAGWGPQEAELRELAKRVGGKKVTFEIRPSDERLRELYQNADALLFPAHEDFGIVPVEAQACGTPVIALDAGGTQETVINGVTGILVRSQSPTAFAHGMDRLARKRPAAEDCVMNASRFGEESFQKRIRAWVEEAVTSPTYTRYEQAA